ncbi:tRNA pseudouridine(38-40) synthase TruA [Thiomicrospira sp. WB1]|uniref:tRNA pseudouridine(38-40) synthase TruA n=1 Tax=Thiomicrospira sp. WB1 TaxID=1685380 RepID=UPI00074634C6|nr:tRNA pseudouridine(38-40) synthase TruA [Thiomicrospira sp. WB1]KUJ71819.1 tRNA pseudouridine synthase A [Thiomicrospira sp. WB1]
MSQRIALGVEYAGTRYCGWQYQPHCDSVQGQLMDALAFIANEPVEMACAGRTDTGVHALGQVAHFDTRAERPNKAWVQGVNTRLPSDIRVTWAKLMPAEFHARFSAEARAYRYVILNQPVASAHWADRVTWERAPLNEVFMHQAGQLLLGERDFSSFRAAGCQASHARRQVQALSVRREGPFVLIDIRANAFLHHMVRNIVGTLLEIGRKERPIDWVSELLALRDRTKAAKTAPATGLYFVNAYYPSQWDVPLAQLDERLWEYSHG